MARNRANGEGSVWEVSTGPSKGKFRAAYQGTDAITGKPKRVYLPLARPRLRRRRSSRTPFATFRTVRLCRTRGSRWTRGYDMVP